MFASHHIKFPAVIIPVIIFLTGCGSTNVSIDEAYQVLEPVKQLELPEQIANNLVISISNVADEYNSYKNRVEVFVNNKRINPNWNVSNVQKNFTYHLRLKPGYNDIKAYYYAYVGWGEEKFEIKAASPVRVTHNTTTIVEYNLVKQENGVPVDKTMIFNARTEAIDNQSAIAGTSDIKSGPGDSPGKVVTLQINTVPENAKIILDDNIVGQAPMKITVDPATDHILQIAADGYKTYTRLLDGAAFKGKEKILVIQELQPLTP